MTNGPIHPIKDILLPVILLVIGAAMTIIFAEPLKNSFYVAVAILAIGVIAYSLLYVTSKVMKRIIIAVTIVGAIILVIYYLTSDRPNFEINFIGLPYQDDSSYYVTDAMIRTKGDLSAYDDFNLIPMQVEVIPNYRGDGKYANIVLRLTGDNGTTKDIELWDKFDNSPRTVELPLADIIAVSGIQETREELDTNLGLNSKPYPQAHLKLQVVRLSSANSILSEKILTVRNTPWIQTAKIVNRKGLTLDYAVENLGPTAKFYCHVLLARAKSDVSSSDHTFWSGADFVKGMDCEDYKLNSGDINKQSLVISSDTMQSDLTHGRYILEVFTFAERADVRFNNGLTYASSGQSWVLANTGDILTFVICNDPGKTCEETDTLAVEEEMVRAFPFDSKSELGNGETYFAVRTYPLGNRAVNRYYLDYWLDPEKQGWVGLGILFEDVVDVSNFNHVRFRLTLDESPDIIWLDVKSISGDDLATSRVFVGDGTYGTLTPEEQVVVIPLSAFSEVDWTAVDSLYFGLDSSHVPDVGKHTLQIAEIEFLR